MRCPHCGAESVPHIAVADIGLTQAQDDDVLTCLSCDVTGSYIEWLRDDIAAGRTRVVVEADASTEETQEHISIELAIHRNKDGGLDRLEAIRSGTKNAA